jgi:hypothetical protein
MTTARGGLPYIWVSWLAKQLGGDQQCLWATWFKAHYRHEKYEPRASQLARWSRDHDELVGQRRDVLEANGWFVHTERENEFRMKGRSAIVAGRPDLVACRDDVVRIVDGKTGMARQSDLWQVGIYAYAFPKTHKDLCDGKRIETELRYAKSDDVVLADGGLTPARLGQIVTTIQEAAADAPARKVPSASECAFCNIGPADCPERIEKADAGETRDF